MVQNVVFLLRKMYVTIKKKSIISEMQLNYILQIS